MLKLKQVLNDLVDYTYLDHPKRALFKKFYVECVDKDMKSYHGVYNIRTHHIKVVNLYRDDASIVATTIHELAHHVDNMLRGDTDHSKEFYEVFVDGAVITMDDYKELKGYGIKVAEIKTAGSEKGQFEELEAFYEAIKNGDGYPIPLWQMEQATKISIMAQE